MSNTQLILDREGLYSALNIIKSLVDYQKKSDAPEHIKFNIEDGEITLESSCPGVYAIAKMPTEDQSAVNFAVSMNLFQAVLREIDADVVKITILDGDIRLFGNESKVTIPKLSPETVEILPDNSQNSQGAFVCTMDFSELRNLIFKTKHATSAELKGYSDLPELLGVSISVDKLIEAVGTNRNAASIVRVPLATKDGKKLKSLIHAGLIERVAKLSLKGDSKVSIYHSFTQNMLVFSFASGRLECGMTEMAGESPDISTLYFDDFQMIELDTNKFISSIKTVSLIAKEFHDNHTDMLHINPMLHLTNGKMKISLNEGKERYSVYEEFEDVNKNKKEQDVIVHAQVENLVKLISKVDTSTFFLGLRNQLRGDYLFPILNVSYNTKDNFEHVQYLMGTAE